MMFNIKALALTTGILWALCVFCVGLAQQVWPGYGLSILEFAASVYPGYEVGGFGSVIVGTLYGLVDGAVCGLVFAWVYNRLAGSAQ